MFHQPTEIFMGFAQNFNFQYMFPTFLTGGAPCTDVISLLQFNKKPVICTALHMHWHWHHLNLNSWKSHFKHTFTRPILLEYRLYSLYHIYKYTRKTCTIILIEKIKNINIHETIVVQDVQEEKHFKVLKVKIYHFLFL